MKPAEAKKRRDGSGMMDFERQQKYRDKPKVAAQAVKDAEKNEKKKEKDRLLQKGEGITCTRYRNYNLLQEDLILTS